MKTISILIAGFGGQGTLFAGKAIANAALLRGLEVTWLPSYGPEMRGGTANCTVVVSESPIGSPLVARPDILIALNKPSFEKYEKTIAAGGYLFADSSLIDVRSGREDIKAFYIPASRTARESGNPGGANMVLIGKAMKETGLFSVEQICEAMTKVVKKEKLIEANRTALELGNNL